MKPQTIKTTAIVLVVVALVAAAATISYYVQQRRITQLQAELLALAEQSKAQPTTQPTAPVEPVEPAVDVPAPSETDAENPPADSESKSGDDAEAEDPSTTRFAFVGKATTSGGTVVLSLDYADFLTGAAAAKAAAKDGEESPPPNDYYISNANSKLRKFSVKKGARFVMLGADPDETTELSAAQFAEAITDNLEGAADAGYWFVIKGDTVLSGKEQWTP